MNLVGVAGPGKTEKGHKESGGGGGGQGREDFFAAPELSPTRGKKGSSQETEKSHLN